MRKFILKKKKKEERGTGDIHSTHKKYNKGEVRSLCQFKILYLFDRLHVVRALTGNK